MGKKDKASPELTKKQRKKLEAREAELVAQLEAAAAEKKAAKKAKKKAAATPPTEPLTAAERDAAAPTEEPAYDVPAVLDVTLALADSVLADPSSSDDDRDKARKARNRALSELDDEALKARVAEKRAEREATPHIAEVVATEQGDIIAVGPGNPDEMFAKPSESRADANAFELNGNGQYKVKRPSDGGEVGYTRVTTYIDVLEHKGAIEAWKMRLLLEGAALAEVADTPEYVLVEVRDIMHRRDVKVAKAHKADRKGKLAAGELAGLLKDAGDEAKRALTPIAERMLDLAGAKAKAEKGTELHALCEVADADGVAAIEQMVEVGTATPADLADVRAYLAACEAAGLKMVGSEVRVVNDDLKVAGRLDRLAMYRREGAQRATKVVADVKTGRIDYGRGKIGMQIALYASSVAYDPETDERTPLGASKTLGLLIHLPAGSATCTIYEVDLTVGTKGIRLAGDVRSWRTAGNAAVDLKSPLVTVGGAS